MRWRRIRRWPALLPYVADSGEGRWTVADAIELGVPAPVITLSLLERLRSRDNDSFTDKLLAAMRNQFGGHAIKIGIICARRVTRWATQRRCARLTASPSPRFSRVKTMVDTMVRAPSTNNAR